MIDPIKNALWGSATEMKDLLFSYFSKEGQVVEQVNQPQPAQ